MKKQTPRQARDAQLQELQARLEEAEETLRAIRSGEVDALAVSTAQGDQVFTLQGADRVYRFFVELMNEGALTLSPDGVILYCNSRFAELIGVPIERVMGARLRDFAAPEEQPALDTLLRQAQTGNSAGELVLRATDGTKMPVYLSIALLKQEAQDVLCAVTMDLTERKRAEAGREKALYYLGERIKELDVMQRAARLLQDASRPLSELLQEVVALLPPAWQYPEIAAARIALDDLEVATPDFIRTRWMQSADITTVAGKHGVIQVCYLEKRPVKDEGPFLAEERVLINSVAEMLQSYLERQHAQEALVESEARFRKLTETTSAAIFIFEPVTSKRQSLRIRYANPTATLITGYTREELLEMRFWELAHPSYQAVLKQRGAANQWADQVPARYELRLRTKDGQDRWVDVTAGMTEFEGKPAIIGTSFDITARAQAEESLRQAHDELEVRVEERTTDLSQAKEELEVMTEELRMQNEELAATRQAAEAERNFVSAVLDTAGALVIVLDRQGQIVRFNHACEQVTGYSFDEVKGRRVWDFLLLRDETEPVRAVFDQLRAGQFLQEYENYWVARDGRRVLIAWRNTALLDSKGQVEYIIGTGIDITARKQAEEKLRQLNRSLRALSNSNQALLRAADEAGYLQEVCNIIVQDCGHAMVWVGYAENDEAKTVRPVAYAGFEEGYLETLKLTWADTERGRGPTGMAIRTGQASMCRDMLTDPNFLPWREQALRRGYASSMALPLMDEDKVLGALTIYFQQPGAVSDEEVELLTELTHDFVYGIRVLRLRAAHAQTEQALRESEERYRGLVEFAPQPIAVHREGKWVYLNPAGLNLLGAAAPSEIIGHPVMDFIHPDSQAIVTGRIRQMQADGRPTPPRDFKMVRVDGQIIDVEVRSTPAVFQGELSAMVMLTDITERKRAEETLEAAHIEAVNERNRLEAVMEALPVGVAILDAQGGAIRVNREFEQVWGGQPPVTREVGDYADYQAWWAGTGKPVQPEEWAAARAVQHGETVIGQTIRIQRFDGARAFILNSAAPIFDAQGQIAGGAVAIMDITQRIKAEEQLALALAEAQQRTAEREAIFAALHDAVLVYDVGMNVLRANPAFLATYGFDPLGMNVKDIIQRVSCRWLDGRPFRLEDQPTPRALRGEKVAGARFLITRPDGADMTVEASSTPLRVGDQVIGSVTVWHDITERERAEREIASLARFPSENPSPVLRISPKGVVLYANKAASVFLEEWECSLGGRVPVDWHDLIAESFASRLNKTVDVECGARIYAMYVTPIAEAGYVNLYGRDITERVQAENELRETRDYLENLFDYANAPIIVWDPQFKVTRFNRAFERLTGRSADQVLGQSLDILFPPERCEEAMGHIRRAVAGERWEVVEIPVLHVDGAVRTVLWNSATLYAADGATAIAAIAQGQDITERKQAEHERERLLGENVQQRRLLETIFAADPDGLAVAVGPDLEFVLINPTYRAFVPQQVDPIGRTYDQIWPDTGVSQKLALLRHVLITGEPLDKECQERVYPDGRKRYFSFHARHLTWSGEPSVLLVMQEVTAAEEARQEAQRRADELDAVFAAMTESVIVYDANGIAVKANPVTVDLGFNPVTQKLTAFVKSLSPRYPDGRPLTADELPAARAVHGETVRNERLLLTDMEGRDHIVLVSASPLLDSQGSVSGAVLIRRDVTEREVLLRQTQEYAEQLRTVNEQLQVQSEELQVQAEELQVQTAELQEGTRELQQLMGALETERARLMAILRQMPAGVIIAEAPSGKVILTNEQADQFLHGPYQQVDWLDQYLRYESYYPTGQTYLPDEVPLARTLRTGEIVADEEIRFVRDDGLPIVVLVSSSPIRDREGHIIAGVMTFHDITARKQAEEQAQQLAAIQERQRLARELHDSVSQALYGIALGTRTARTLLDREPRQAIEPLDYVQTLAGAGLAEMRALIFELRPESLETEGLAVAITKQVDATRARHGIEVQAKLCEEPDLALSAKEALYRIAQESLHNAVKHAKASRLDVMLDCVGGHVILEVRDNGVGFDPEASFPGHLGLRSMRERVARLGGVLDIESAPGRGACIRARIPTRKM